MTSHQPPSPPAPRSDRPAGSPVERVEQRNGDRIPVAPLPPAACQRCGVVYHADDLLLGRCEGCDA